MKKLLLALFTLLVISSCATSTVEPPTGYLDVPFGCSIEEAIKIMQQQGFGNYTPDVGDRISYVSMMKHNISGSYIDDVNIFYDRETKTVDGFVIVYDDLTLYNTMVERISSQYGRVELDNYGRYYWDFGNTGISISIDKESPIRKGGFNIRYDKRWRQTR